MTRTTPTLAALIAVLPALACAQVEQGPPNADFTPAFENQTRAPAMEETAVDIGWFAEGLEHPWGIAPLPGGGYLVTERPGRLRHVAADGTLSDPIAGLPGPIDTRAQGGLLDVTVAPDFAESREIYVTWAKRMGDETMTAASRATLSEDMDTLTDVALVFVQQPPSVHPMHFGSRVVVAPDGTLFITTGEHSAPEDRVKAQDPETTYGKVVRVTPEGEAPADNPFVGRAGVDTIWSLGHRNIQGATIGPDGELWTVEHGPAGGDELNRPEAGLNYGWPEVSYGVNYNGTPVGTGEARAEGFEEPVYYWDPVIAPGGMTFYDGDAFPEWQGDLLIASLNPGALVRLRLEDGRVTGEARPVTDEGRIRDVQVAPDGTVLLLVDATDGGILRVAPAQNSG